MLVELITPIMLATAPVTVDAPVQVYDHKAQQVVMHDSTSETKRIFASSTRTFDAWGKPYDSDQD